MTSGGGSERLFQAYSISSQARQASHFETLIRLKLRR
jgi:hypothetical protein